MERCEGHEDGASAIATTSTPVRVVFAVMFGGTAALGFYAYAVVNWDPQGIAFAFATLVLAIVIQVGLSKRKVSIGNGTIVSQRGFSRVEMPLDEIAAWEVDMPSRFGPSILLRISSGEPRARTIVISLPMFNAGALDRVIAGLPRDLESADSKWDQWREIWLG